MATRRCPKCKLINPGATAVCDCGWSFVDGTLTAPRRLPSDHEDGSNHRSRGAAQIGIGALFVVVGIIITGATYGSASGSGGGTYVIAYGPIVVGIVTIIRGLMNR